LMIKSVLFFACFLVAHIEALRNTKDNSTYGNINVVHTEHMWLNFAVDFDASTFDGEVIHRMKVLVDGTKTVFMDKVGMDIHGVQFRMYPAVKHN
jgi:aminopeptidase N